MLGRNSRSRPVYPVRKAVFDQGRPKRNSSVPEKSLECSDCCVKGPASRITLPENESQFPIGLLETYKNWRNRFWFMLTGSIVSRRSVNCNPGVTLNLRLPSLNTGVTPKLKIVSSV